MNGQWQGGADPVTFVGAKEITKMYLAGLDHVILPVDDGLSGKEVYDILTAASDRLVGLGIYEYAPSGTGNALVEKLIRFGTAL